MKTKKYSHWIWGEEGAKDLDEPVIVLFRKKLCLPYEPEEAKVTVSADSRYKLYVNEKLVEVGPLKGDSQIWFQDELEITPYLKEGLNVIAAEVMRFPQDPFRGNQSVMVTPFPGFYLTGTCRDRAGREYDFSADSSWRYLRDTRVRVQAESEGFAPLHFYEDICEDASISGWKEAGYDDGKWKQAVPYTERSIRKNVSPGNLNPRTIPFMYRKKRRFERLRRVVCSKTEPAHWENFLAGKGHITIEAGAEEIVEIDAGEEMTGYLKMEMTGGKGSRIEVLQSEAYVQNGTVQNEPQPGTPVKTDRTDCVNGHLEGYMDIYHPSGGENGQIQVFEPFWFRTFRFIRLHIICEEEPLVLHDFTYDETGYPLKIRSHAETSDPSLEGIWEISERTLKRCMHETYEDCPFYEQLQYVMDSRSQILYTYASAADDRLARKCMDDFRRSQRYDGLLCSAYPNTKPNVIPGFSIYYILMLQDHMMYFGDQELVRRHMPAVENILYFFESHLTEKGCVGKIGDVHGKGRFWSFIDWVPGWISGVPNAAATGSITMESLLYLTGLKAASELAGYIGREELAREYRKQGDVLAENIRKYCTGKNGMLKDGPDCEEYSQHCQVFGILSGVFDREEGKKSLLATVKERGKYPQCTVSMALYLFRALEQTGLYGYTDIYWEIWRKMVKNKMTTCAESDVAPRSECHAWGALALYELPSVILGVRPASPGYKRVRIRPVPGYLKWARGEVVTPKGIVAVSWKKEKDGIHMEYTLPDGMEAEEEENNL
ncbi:MAG TPA: hypothetical protein H9909_01935 [Candidatus Mediterraneibacter norfolkensis]|nr:hypothetical protein [Candidatus Mediterraneibacter norfolkensis]